MDTVDDLAEFAIGFLISGRGNARQLTRALVEGWPQRPALEMIFTLSITANSIEEVFASTDSAAMAHDAWRMAGLVGADLFMAQSAGLPHYSAADLAAYWQTHDPFFLTG